MPRASVEKERIRQSNIRRRKRESERRADRIRQGLHPFTGKPTGKVILIKKRKVKLKLKK